jgi:membrane-bound serine protease (ClpP class)
MLDPPRGSPSRGFGEPGIADLLSEKPCLDGHNPMESMIADPFFSALFVGMGLLLVLLEVFIPSGGILGLLALAAIGFGVFGFFYQESYGLGTGSLLGAVVFAGLTVRYALRRLSFSAALDPATSNVIDEEIVDLEGKEGITLTPLRPAGAARIDGKRVDVVTTGQFIDKDRPIRVVEVSGNRVVVREHPPGRSPS